MGNDWLTGMLFLEEQRIHIQGYVLINLPSNALLRILSYKRLKLTIVI